MFSHLFLQSHLLDIIVIKGVSSFGHMDKLSNCNKELVLITNREKRKENLLLSSVLQDGPKKMYFYNISAANVYIGIVGSYHPLPRTIILVPNYQRVH